MEIGCSSSISDVHGIVYIGKKVLQLQSLIERKKIFFSQCLYKDSVQVRWHMKFCLLWQIKFRVFFASFYLKSRAADRLKILIAINHAIKKFNRD